MGEPIQTDPNSIASYRIIIFLGSFFGIHLISSRWSASRNSRANSWIFNDIKDLFWTYSSGHSSHSSFISWFISSFPHFPPCWSWRLPLHPGCARLQGLRLQHLYCQPRRLQMKFECIATLQIHQILSFNMFQFMFQFMFQYYSIMLIRDLQRQLEDALHRSAWCLLTKQVLPKSADVTPLQ